MAKPHTHPAVAAACLDILHHTGTAIITVPRGWIACRFMNAVRYQLRKLGYDIKYATDIRRSHTLLHVTILGRDPFTDPAPVTPAEERGRYQRRNEPLA